jgi:hypothetical protein
MVPAKGSLIDLSESETTALIGIHNVSEIIVEVMESCVATRCLADNRSWSSGCCHGYFILLGSYSSYTPDEKLVGIRCVLNSKVGMRSRGYAVGLSWAGVRLRRRRRSKRESRGREQCEAS